MIKKTFLLQGILAFIVSCASCCCCAGGDEDLRRGGQLLGLEKFAYQNGRDDKLQKGVLIDKLISILQAPAKTPRFYDASTDRNTAIAMLGLLHAKAAIPELIETQTPWLDKHYKHYRNVFSQYRRSALSPASIALCTIGSPCIEPILQQLKRLGAGLNGYESLKVLVILNGFDNTVHLLLKEAESSREASVKDKLLECIRILKRDAKVMKNLPPDPEPVIRTKSPVTTVDPEKFRIFGGTSETTVDQDLSRIELFATWEEAEQSKYLDGLIAAEMLSSEAAAFLSRSATNGMYSTSLRTKMLSAIMSCARENAQLLQFVEQVILDKKLPADLRKDWVQMVGRYSVDPAEAHSIQRLLSNVAKANDGPVGREAALLLALRWKLDLVDLEYAPALLEAALRNHTMVIAEGTDYVKGMLMTLDHHGQAAGKLGSSIRGGRQETKTPSVPLNGE